MQDFDHIIEKHFATPGAMLYASGIHKHYGQLHVLKGVEITVNRGEIVSLVGASGAGKSTLLQILGTLDDPGSGQVWFEQTAVHGLSERQKADFRNTQLGFVFQFHHLLPEFNALENVALPAYIQGTDRQAAEKRALELLGYLGLKSRAEHRPSQLSGGEAQRVAVARALINDPALILADEPTGNLDSANSEHLYKLFVELARDFKVGFLITTHNEELAKAADRRLRMKDGLIVMEMSS